MFTIGNILKELRLNAGLTQQELADKLGFADSVIRRYESGRGHAKVDTLQKYADVLGVNVESLIYADLNSSRAMHHLFRIFEAYKGEFHTVTTTTTDSYGNQIEKETVAVSFDKLDEYIKEWKTKYEESVSSDGETSKKADYDYYVYNFPDSSNLDQSFKDMMIEYDKEL